MRSRGRFHGILGPVLFLAVLAPLGAFAETFLVTTIDDSGPGSLRQALESANAHSGADSIAFAFPGTGVHSIQPERSLPSVTDTLVIDGYTQPGSSTCSGSTPATLAVELDGSFCADAASGIVISASGCTVRGLAINRFAASGIAILSHGATTIAGNHIGTNVPGTSALPNWFNGVRLWESCGNVIGGTDPADRNVISGNHANGIFVQGENSKDNLVLGNYIGVDAWGDTQLGNGGGGIQLLGAPQNTVGGSTSGSGNTISWNGGYGILITGAAASMNRIEGNLIGTDAAGVFDLGNRGYGVFILKASRNTIGGTTPGAGNVISGNQASGVYIWFPESHENVVQGNLIGTDITGARDLGNSGSGVDVWLGSATTIGGAVPGARNVISGNEEDGVVIQDGSGPHHVIQGNYVGTDLTGTADLGNSGYGIHVSSDLNTIGGTVPGAGNLVSGNINAGVALGGGHNAVCGNLIGVDATGNAPICNEGGGIFAAGHHHTIGGLTPNEANVISGNVGCGIYLWSAEETTVKGNLIGLSVGGDSLGNSEEGIYLRGSSRVLIGGEEPGAGNAVAFNGSHGVRLRDSGEDSRLNSILGNSIHSNQGLGIELVSSDDDDAGVTPNDPGDADGGPNDLLNFPELTALDVSDSSTVIEGTVNTHPFVQLRIELFSSASADPSGFGEGEVFLGCETVVTDSAGNGAFSATVPIELDPGRWVSATASDPLGNTSEFSAALGWNPVAVESLVGIPQSPLNVEIYPSPPTDYAVIRITGAAGRDVSTSIYDLAGRRVRVVQEGALQPGGLALRWDCRDDAGRPVAAGPYACVVRLGQVRYTAVFVRTK